MADAPAQVLELRPAFKGLSHITSAFNGRLLFSCSLIALSQLNFGMEQGVFANTQAMTPFNEKFGVYDAKTKAYVIEPQFLSFLNSFPYIGFAFGLVTGSFISRRFGRRMTMFSMCVWALIGATILVTSQRKEQVLVGRIIANIYIGMELAVVPVFQSELVPARVRGFVVGTYQQGLLIGQLVAALICRGTSGINSEASFRIPFGLLYIVPCIVAGSVWFMPESPRWLLMKDRPEDALSSLRTLRQGRFSEEEIQQEFQLLKFTINLTVEKGRFYEMFQGTNRRRTLIAIGTNIFLQITGQNFVSIYGTIFIKSLGTVNPFTMSSVNVAISIVVVFITMVLSDRIGRKILLIAGAIMQTAALFTMGGLGTAKDPSLAVKRGITAMVSIFGAAYAFGWAPLSHVVVAEIPTTRLRDKTYATASMFNIAIQFAVSFSIPYLLYAPYANLGSKVGFIFGSCAFCAIIFSWLCIPECSGKSLEEIDELFVQGTPIRRFRNVIPRLPADAMDGNEKAVTIVHAEVVP